jgi:hypothetical protein
MMRLMRGTCDVTPFCVAPERVHKSHDHSFLQCNITLQGAKRNASILTTGHAHLLTLDRYNYQVGAITHVVFLIFSLQSFLVFDLSILTTGHAHLLTLDRYNYQVGAISFASFYHVLASTQAVPLLVSLHLFSDPLTYLSRTCWTSLSLPYYLILLSLPTLLLERAEQGD